MALDLSKALDCVSHDRLIVKLDMCGVRGLPLALLNSYVSNRKQCVSGLNENSEFINIHHGVPQGSVLGPLLYLIYVNDFSQHMSSTKHVLFADDTTLLCSHNNIETLKLMSLEKEALAQNWFTCNRLKLNHDKTQRLIISSNNSLCNGDNVKLLGIHIDDKLNWNAHTEHLVRKLSSINFLLRKLQPILDTAVLKNSYFALFHSHLCYAVTVWGNSYNSIRVFRQQKKAIRIITSSKSRDHCRPLFLELNIMPLPSLFIYFSLIIIHERVSTLPKNADIHEHATRSAGSLRLPRFRLEMSSKNSLNLNLYNHLPNNLKMLNQSSFKRRVKRIMLRHCFYSVDEYLQTPL